MNHILQVIVLACGLTGCIMGFSLLYSRSSSEIVHGDSLDINHLNH